MPEELEREVLRILQDPYEDRTVDFKSPATWKDCQFALARAVLGMANLPAYGYIVIGVDEHDGASFVLRGLTPAQLATFRFDPVLDGLNKFVEPSVDLLVGQVDHAGDSFFAIRVAYNGTRPVKARRGHEGKGQDHVEKGKIYFRPKGPRPQTRVATPEDIEEIVSDLVDAELRNFNRRAQLAGYQPVGTAPEAAVGDGYGEERRGFE